MGYEKHPKNDKLGVNVLLLKENQRSFKMKKLISFDDEMFSERIKYSTEHIPAIPLLIH